jgi:hypothetical protein
VQFDVAGSNAGLHVSNDVVVLVNQMFSNREFGTRWHIQSDESTSHQNWIFGLSIVVWVAM